MLTEVEAPLSLDHPFAAILFDWDGVAASNRPEDAKGFARLAEALLIKQVWLVAVTSANFETISREFCSLIAPPARRYLLVGARRGAEIYGFDASGAAVRRYQRLGTSLATPLEDKVTNVAAEQPRIPPSDATHLEGGLTDTSDAVEWVKKEILEPEGIALSDMLVVGDEFGALSPGDAPRRVSELLLDQLCAHREADRSAQHTTHTIAPEWLRAVTQPPENSLWRLEAHGYDDALEHSVESRFTTANGALGVRGALALPTAASNPAMFVAGLFDLNNLQNDSQAETPPLPALVPLPDPTHFHLKLEGKELSLEQGTIQSLHRWLDMRRGVYGMDWRHTDPEGRSVDIQIARFASLQHRALQTQIARIAVAQPASLQLIVDAEPAPENLRLVQKTPCGGAWETLHSARRLEQARISSLSIDGKIAPRHLRKRTDSGLSWSWQGLPGQPATFSQVIATTREQPHAEDEGRVVAMVEQAHAEGVARLLAAHERAWAGRWAASDVEIEGDDEAQRALRFALYHLISAANPGDEHVSIGARGLTGEAYLGHVFWDTEIFMLPFYTFTWPAAARALLMYRYHTLPAARAKAVQMGYRGALYAWESADTGEETTPPYVRMLDGRVIPILCGSKEQHISADVAYAVWQYWQATDDNTFLLDAGAEIMLETARFWASRAEPGADDHYHIRQVIGPDEYHPNVDDNAFTNEMARWNIERGLEVAVLLGARWPERWNELSRRLVITPDELAAWREVAEKLIAHQDPQTQVIEQFAGFSALEPLDLSSLPPHDVPVDMLLGAERITQLQVLKQADVVMLLALLWDHFPPEVRAANFRYYEPICAHGSSLSPSMHALVAARLGDMKLADHYLRRAAAIDLDDTMGNSELGMHMAALGGLWQATALGLTGLSLCPDGLRFDPHLPESWSALRTPVQWHGRLLRIAIQQPPLRLAVTLERGKPLTLHLAGLHSRLRSGQSWRCRWNECAQGWEEEA